MCAKKNDFNEKRKTGITHKLRHIVKKICFSYLKEVVMKHHNYE